MRSEANIPEYIIAICPDDEVVAKVAGLKQQLYNAIGWFGSYRSLAHITIDAFNADEEILQRHIGLLKTFASKQKGHILTFNTVSWFGRSRTVFLAPDSGSEIWLNQLAKLYSEVFPHNYISPGFKAHLTIGRAINPQYFIKAKEVFFGQQVCMSFLCNNIALRKFNHVTKQYDIVERYYFGEES